MSNPLNQKYTTIEEVLIEIFKRLIKIEKMLKEKNNAN